MKTTKINLTYFKKLVKQEEKKSNPDYSKIKRLKRIIEIHKENEVK